MNPLIKKIFRPPVSYLLGNLYGYLATTLLNKSLTIFVYHDINDNPSEFSRNYDLNVNLEVFTKQIAFINKEFNIINVDHLLKNEIPPRAAMITFDDGLLSYFENAVPILESQKVPSIIFLNMAAIQGDIFFSGLITYLCEKHNDFQKYIINANKPIAPGKPLFLYCKKDLVEKYLKEHNLSLKHEVKTFVGEFATESDLEKAAINPYVFYGNHLFNHEVPVLMSDEELIASYKKNQKFLDRYPNGRNIFSFPFGQPDSCFSFPQVDLLKREGVQRIFYSSGKINTKTSSVLLDRLPLNNFHEKSHQLWFGIFRKIF